MNSVEKATSPVLYLPEDLPWMEEELTDSYSPMAMDGETSQVHPYLFTASMFGLAKPNCVNYIKGKTISIVQDLDGNLNIMSPNLGLGRLFLSRK